MTIAEFDQKPVEEKKKLLERCCGSDVWVKKMLAIFPVQNLVDLMEFAEEEWYECNPADWLESFQNHIKIGDKKTLQKKFENDDQWAFYEQSGVFDCSSELQEEVEKANELYEETFGYPFIVSATGKSAQEMLDNLLQRLDNDPHEELMIAAAEQNKITQIRLKKLFA
jgi:2-oxo-4-hydroxy-4-carboxy-5-ureidoimidazoline decarboxylase